MKRGQQTCKEPKLRQCVLITGNRNMSALMSASFYLEMKMHLRCPDPLFFFFFEHFRTELGHTRARTRACVHAHANVEGPFPQQKELSEKQSHRLCLFSEAENQAQVSAPDSSPCVEKGGKGMRRHLLLGRVCEELCDEVFCWCLWVTEVNILHFHSGGKSASILVNVKNPAPSSLSRLQRSRCAGFRRSKAHRH